MARQKNDPADRDRKETLRPVQEALEDLEDIRSLREAKEAERDEPAVPLAEVKKALGLD